jgi:hypothetical protein
MIRGAPSCSGDTQLDPLDPRLCGEQPIDGGADHHSSRAASPF